MHSICTLETDREPSSGNVRDKPLATLGVAKEALMARIFLNSEPQSKGFVFAPIGSLVAAG